MSDRILVVDDSLTVRMDLDETFRAAGFETTLCASAEDARAALADAPASLIVLDVVLPDCDGIELLAELRQTAVTRRVPILLLSAEAEVKDRIRGLEGGADEYVGKPYDPAYVVSRATELLRKSGEAAPAALTVLVIDDSPTYREDLADVLREAGYSVILAGSGEEGLQRAAAARPDAIVVDGVMPGIDGTTVVRRIRLDSGLADTPCLLLTASEGAAGEVVALDAGADAYVRKTEGTQLVLARLGAILRAAQASRDRAHAPSLLGPKRILAVDDSTTYLEELADQLRSDGYEVVKARSGAEALELLAVEDIDCILLDLVMPGLSGTDTCRRVKASPATRRIPLIMLTALDRRDAMIEGINAGADDYVSKSANIDVLRARLRAQLRRKQFEDENRRVRDELMRKETEAESARQIAEVRRGLLDELSRKNEALAYHVAELERLNKELEVFAYSVSHDLRQPLRGMDGFSKVLLERYADRLDDQGKHYLRRVRAGAQRMGSLIDGLLTLSRASRQSMDRQGIALDVLADRVIARLRDAEPLRSVEVTVQDGLYVNADPALTESMLENLIGNAWKFTSRRDGARIEIGALTEGDERVLFVRDNGAGFDMAYADKLFGPFQRLHAHDEFDGTGIGLATVQRIVHRHNGRIWAESKAGEGATFYFTMGEESAS